MGGREEGEEELIERPTATQCSQRIQVPTAGSLDTVKAEEIYRCHGTPPSLSRSRKEQFEDMSQARLYGDSSKKVRHRGKNGRKDLRRTGRVNEAFLVLTTVGILPLHSPHPICETSMTSSSFSSKCPTDSSTIECALKNSAGFNVYDLPQISISPVTLRFRLSGSNLQ